ncbi:MAG: LPP20 family lipoprotein [Selenomonadaceae bacterium]|nr:LPP20 family lipoprotein [Selenomonadaceae bacterium]
MVKRIFLLLAACLLLITGTVMAQAPYEDPYDWEQGVITVTGEGMAPPTAVNATHGRILAKRAATLDGYRKLAELVKGVQVNAESRVENLMIADDAINARVEACIKGAKVTAERDLPEGGYEVTVTLPMFGSSNPLAAVVLPRPAAKEPFPAPSVRVSVSVTQNTAVNPYPTTVNSYPYTTALGGYAPRSLASLSLFPAVQSIDLPDFSNAEPYAPTSPGSYPTAPAAVYDAAPSTVYDTGVRPEGAPRPEEIPTATGGYTGLVIDCSGLNLEPCMSPVIRNDQGEAIYGVKNLDYDLVVVKGMASYLKSLEAVADSARAGANPLVVKCLSLERNNIDPVISLEDANRALVENEQSHFLADLNVVFVR